MKRKHTQLQAHKIAIRKLLAAINLWEDKRVSSTCEEYLEAKKRLDKAREDARNLIIESKRKKNES